MSDHKTAYITGGTKGIGFRDCENFTGKWYFCGIFRKKKRRCNEGRRRT